MSDTSQAERPYELAVERYLVDRLTALLRDPPRLSDQEIRARALNAAVHAWAPLRGSDPEAYADAISDVALAFEEYIRDGVPEERGSAEERSDDPSNASDLGGVS